MFYLMYPIKKITYFFVVYENYTIIHNVNVAISNGPLKDVCYSHMKILTEIILASLKCIGKVFFFRKYQVLCSDFEKY